MMESDAEVEANEAKARRLRARAELARAEADLLESEMRLKEVKRKRYALENGQAVKLWVGKTSYRVARDTLMLSPTLRNMLEAPPEAGRADVDGSYFVDRDAKIFEEIIHFLRYGNLSMNCQKDHDLRRLLAHDAEYFQLKRLERICHVGFKPQLLPNDDIKVLEEFRALLARFRSESEIDAVSDQAERFQGLVDIYSEGDQGNLPVDLPPMGRDVYDDASNHLLGLELARNCTAWDGSEDDHSIPTTEEEFIANLKATTGGILKGLPSSVRKAAVVAGGSVSAALCGQSRVTDVDFFLVNAKDDKHAVAVIVDLANHLKGLTEKKDVVLVRMRNAVTICCGPDLPQVQVVLKKFSCPAEVLASFDMAPCQFLYDPLKKKAFGTRWGLRSLQTRVSVVDPCSRHVKPDGSSMFESRLVKYAKRGFAILVPGFEPQLIPSSSTSPALATLNAEGGSAGGAAAATNAGEAGDSSSRSSKSRGLRYLLELLEAETNPANKADEKAQAPGLPHDYPWENPTQGCLDASFWGKILWRGLYDRDDLNEINVSQEAQQAPFASSFGQINMAVRLPWLPRTGNNQDPKSLASHMRKIHFATEREFSDWTEKARMRLLEQEDNNEQQRPLGCVGDGIGPCPLLGFCWTRYHEDPDDSDDDDDNVRALRNVRARPGDMWFEFRWYRNKHIGLPVAIEFPRPYQLHGSAHGTAASESLADRYITDAYAA